MTQELKPINQEIKIYQDIKTTPTQNYSIGSPEERLLSTKTVRLYERESGCICESCKEYYLELYTIDLIDNENPENEGEKSLFLLKEKKTFLNLTGPYFYLTFLNFDSNTEFSFGIINEDKKKETVHLGFCDSYDYYIYSDLISEIPNSNLKCILKRYDSRSFYRTWTSPTFNGGYYIGNPYVEPPKVEKSCCESFCCCCNCSSSQNNNIGNKNNCCSCCCQNYTTEKKYEDPYRIFSPYYNLITHEEEGQFVFCNIPGKCFKSERKFYEINFPENADLIMRIGLISGFFSFWYLDGFSYLLSHSYIK